MTQRAGSVARPTDGLRRVAAKSPIQLIALTTVPLTNMFRAFGADALLVAVIALPLLVVYVAARSRALARRYTHPRFIAALEAIIGLAAIGVAVVTLIPSEAASDAPHSIDWSLLASDLSYAPERTQVLGNLVLFMPLLAFLTIRTATRRPLRLSIPFAVVLPALVEFLQYAVVAGRASTLEDWFLGSLGGVVAAGIGTVLLSTAWLRGRVRRLPPAGAPTMDQEIENAA